MKALYALAFVCLSAPALAIDWYAPSAPVIEYEYAAPVASYQAIPSEDESLDPTFDFAAEATERTTIATVDPATIWHEFDYDVKDGIKVAKADPSEIWHEFDYDLKDGVKVAKVDPSTIWHEFDYDLENGVKVAKADPSTELDQETTASIPAKDTLLGDYYVEEAFVMGARPY